VSFLSFLFYSYSYSFLLRTSDLEILFVHAIGWGIFRESGRGCWEQTKRGVGFVVSAWMGRLGKGGYFEIPWIPYLYVHLYSCVHYFVYMLR
jgi:hypothetical protein